MEGPMKILIHGMTGNLGGMESCIINYYRNINSNKVRFDFLCVNERPVYYQEIIAKGSNVYIIPGRRKYFSHCKQLMSIFKEGNYDGLWSNRCDLSGTVLFFKIASMYSVPLRILHAHNSGNMLSFMNRFAHEIDKHRIKKYVTDFWSCSKKASHFFYSADIICSLKHKIIHNAIDVDKFQFNSTERFNIRKKMGLEDKIIIGHVGRFHFQKNHGFLLNVFYEIYKKKSNAVLLLIGDGELRLQIENSVKALGLINSVYFLGTRSDIPALLNAIDIFILPSKFEGLPVSLIEAQAMSLPCFTSTNVSSESAITESLYFVGLDKSPREWAEFMLEKNNVRKNMAKKIKDGGYDIKTEATRLEEFLLNKGADVD